MAFEPAFPGRLYTGVVVNLASWIASLIGVALLADSIRAWRRSLRRRAAAETDADAEEDDAVANRMAG